MLKYNLKIRISFTIEIVKIYIQVYSMKDINLMIKRVKTCTKIKTFVHEIIKIMTKSYTCTKVLISLALYSSLVCFYLSGPFL